MLTVQTLQHITTEPLRELSTRRARKISSQADAPGLVEFRAMLIFAFLMGQMNHPNGSVH